MGEGVAFSGLGDDEDDRGGYFNPTQPKAEAKEGHN